MIKPFLVRHNTRDLDIFNEVVTNNGYHLPDTMNGVVVDIGAHIGCFSVACQMRGASRVVAFEADKINFSLAKNNTDAEIHNKAVWRSDVDCKVLNHTGYRDNNTGIGNVIGWLQPVDANIEVYTISLDTIIDDVGRIDLLKLDCEGSEYCILGTSKRLDKVREIVGEYHTLTSMIVPEYARIPGWDVYSGGTLLEFLRSCGFETERWGHKGKTGMFRAWK